MNWLQRLITTLCIAIATTVQPIYPQSDNDGFPAGEVTEYKFSVSEIYPGTERTFWLYIPAAYTGQTEACLYIALDEIPYGDTATLDRLISAGEIPVMIGVFVASGTVFDDKGVVRFNRSNEFDTRSDAFARFLETELLPYVETLTAKDGRPLKLSKDPNDRMIHGNSSGAICAFTAAWTRPDLFRRVYSAIGTYVWMRGGNEYPAMIRKNEPKPIRIFLQDTYDDVWNPLFGSWFEANVLMESALRFAGYDMKHEWGEGAHDGVHASRIFPDVLRWLWRDWPDPVEKGISQNDMLAAILNPASEWVCVGEGTGTLFSDRSGRVWLMSHDGLKSISDDSITNVRESRIRSGDKVMAALNGVLYGTDIRGRLIKWENDGRKNIGGKLDGIVSVAVHNDGAIHAMSRDGEIWLVDADGSSTLVGKQDNPGECVSLFPDGRMLAVTEKNSHWMSNCIIGRDGLLRDSQRWYWLHNSSNRESEPVGNMMFDIAGNLYVATMDGVQVCDHNGRVRAILSPPGGGVVSLCFGGQGMSMLYVVSGGVIYKREMKSKGFSNGDEPHEVPRQGAG